METIYLILIVVLFVLAASDLIIGVSNDAVNFLNSAIGSKAASLKTILIIAALGVLVGATFSSGMMEIARKGIFHPQYFYFSELMIIFLAVMLTDVLLLDMFNTLGMPTSTTVSIVFELLGAAVAIAVIKVYFIDSPDAKQLGEYINSGKALAIISGILLSVVVAFTSGVLIQALSRMLFSFNLKKNVKYFGAVWGGVAIAAITYFILIKGAKGASFMNAESKHFIRDNAALIILTSAVFWTIFLQLLTMFTKINILKVIVFIGTFALAMAFAGNDLVNFIGVPLAGYEAYKVFLQDPSQLGTIGMQSLTGKVATPTFFLLLAGLIMVFTLWFSKKAKSVIKTSLDLGRQDEGEERFGSSAVSRQIVRSSTNLLKTVEKVTPNSLLVKIRRNFDQTPFLEQQSQYKDVAPDFDLLRASVTLVVASILISIGTAMKLPLSTTYVTFMVAMGTSLADGAWGRESAVYRVTGVLAVIGGWFFTAFSAFTASFILATLFYYLGFYGIFGIVILASIMLFRTHLMHKKKQIEIDLEKEEEDQLELTDSKILQKSSENIYGVLSQLDDIFKASLIGLEKEDRDGLNLTYKNFKKLNQKTKSYKSKIPKTIHKLAADSIDTGHYYVQVVDYLREITHSMFHIVNPILQHVENNHKPLIEVQLSELKAIETKISSLFQEITTVVRENKHEDIPKLIEDQQIIFDSIKVAIKSQIKRLKEQKIGTRNSILYFNILSEAKNLSLFTINLAKAHRDFIEELDKPVDQ